MFFTQEDYKKIEQWLSRNAIKDTEFNNSVLPLKGNEEVTIIQDGHNKKLLLKDLANNIKLLGDYDFINISESFNAKYISLQNAISLIPYRSRKLGQVITFLETNGNWGIYQFKGESLEVWDNTTLWVNVIESLHIDSILPDEEDLTITTPDIQGNVKMKFKDKEYNPLDFSGLGKVYLRKNIISTIDTENNIAKDINLLNQQALSKENTIYVIQYDFDLNGAEITIPEGCVLQFEGGSLNNGTLVFNNTTLLSKVNINCRFSGRIANESIHLEWFTGNDYDVIQDAINCINIYRPGTSLYAASVQEIKFKNGKVYTIDKELNFGHYLKIDGNEAIIKNTTVGGTIFKSTLAFYINVCNLNFIGTNVKAFHVPAPNYDDARFRFKNLCIQTDNYDKSIENNYAFVLSSRSCHIILEQIDCQQAVQFLRCTADFVYLKDSWINGYSNKTSFVRPENTCSINNEGTSRMTIRNTVFIPEYDGETPNKDTRWIDNYAHLSIQDSHFGGENAGYAIIWQYKSPDNLSELAMHHCQIDISNTQCAAGAYYKYWGGLVVLMKNVLPGKFCFKNTYPAVQTQLISLYGWVKDEGYSFTNYDEVYSKAAPLFCEYVNQHINNKTFLPSKSIYTENSISVDKCFRPFLGNNNINFNPSEFDKDLIFGILHRLGYNSSAYQWSEYKFRVGVSGYHTNGNTFCKYITYRFVVHQQAGANPRIFTYTEDSSISKTWGDMPDDLLSFSLKCSAVNTYTCNLSIKITKSSDISSGFLGVSIQPILIGATHSAISALPSFYPMMYK